MCGKPLFYDFLLFNFSKMNFPKFKLVDSSTKEAFGFEYLTIGGWKNDVFDCGERRGSFDQRELGDGFLGIVQRLQFVGLLDKNGTEVFEGDVFDDDDVFLIRWAKDLGCFEFYYTTTDESACDEINWYDAYGYVGERVVESNIYLSSIS